jgi:hypothetical protein
MRRSPVTVGATCAAILLSSIAYAQQPKAQPPAYLADTKEVCRHYKDRPTWTLFLVAVPYNGPWTITAVAAFNTKDNKGNKDSNNKDSNNKDSNNKDSNNKDSNNKDSNNKDSNNKDMACEDCFDVLTLLNNGSRDPNYPIPGLHREAADANKAEGTAQYLACLPAAAPTQQRSSTGSGDSTHSDN